MQTPGFNIFILPICSEVKMSLLQKLPTEGKQLNTQGTVDKEKHFIHYVIKTTFPTVLFPNFSGLYFPQCLSLHHQNYNSLVPFLYVIKNTFPTLPFSVSSQLHLTQCLSVCHQNYNSHSAFLSVIRNTFSSVPFSLHQNYISHSSILYIVRTAFPRVSFPLS